jgi:hypothetical protein
MIYIEVWTICGFRHPLGVLEYIPCRQRQGLYQIFSCFEKSKGVLHSQGSPASFNFSWSLGTLLKPRSLWVLVHQMAMLAVSISQSCCCCEH